MTVSWYSEVEPSSGRVMNNHHRTRSWVKKAIDKVRRNDIWHHGYRIYRNIKEFKNCYVYEFEEDAFMKRHAFITDFYDAVHEELDREYLYLTEQEMDAFVEYAANEIEKECYAGRFAVSRTLMDELF